MLPSTMRTALLAAALLLSLGPESASATETAVPHDFAAALDGHDKLELSIDRLEEVRDSTLTPGVAWKGHLVTLARTTLQGDALAMLRTLIARADTVVTDDFPFPVCDSCVRVAHDYFALRVKNMGFAFLLQVDPCSQRLVVSSAKVGGSVGFDENSVGINHFLVEMFRRAGKTGALAADSLDCHSYQRGDIAYVTICAVLSSPRPEYPSQARSSGIDGTVLVDALVGTDGSVQAVHVRESIPMLDEAALESVRKWRFQPATFRGSPRAVWVICPVRFTLH